LGRSLSWLVVVHEGQFQGGLIQELHLISLGIHHLCETLITSLGIHHLCETLITPPALYSSSASNSKKAHGTCWLMAYITHLLFNTYVIQSDMPDDKNDNIETQFFFKKKTVCAAKCGNAMLISF
jgi:hypothetical protein